MKKIGWLLIAGLLLTGCTNTTDIKEEENISIEERVENQDKSTEETTNDETTPEETEEVIENETVDEVEEVVEEVIDLTSEYIEHGVNESGKVLVIMYHNLAERTGAYATTPELFRQDLERLYREGYRTVSMSDLIDNKINIPIGTTPVVLTFDDASKSNFYYDDDGNIADDCVVGILEAFYETNPEFGRNAIFYVNGGVPFRQRDSLEQKMQFLLDNGYEIGNHTFGHESLKKLGAEGIQEAIGRNEAFIGDLLAGYQMRHMSLPFGQRPGDDKEAYLWQGVYQETTYEIDSAVNVGWNPIVSPAHVDFNPKSINRITCGDDEAELNFWLDQLLLHPERRYYSDGDPETIVVPEDRLEAINDIYKDKVITYKESEEE